MSRVEDDVCCSLSTMGTPGNCTLGDICSSCALGLHWLVFWGEYDVLGVNKDALPLSSNVEAGDSGVLDRSFRVFLG